MGGEQERQSRGRIRVGGAEGELQVRGESGLSSRLLRWDGGQKEALDQAGCIRFLNLLSPPA